MTTIIEKVRNLNQDNLKATFDIFEYNISKVFTLSEANIDSTTLTCLLNGTVWATSNYTYSTSTGKVTVTGTLTVGDEIEFDYSAYTKYSDGEIRGYIKAAISYLAIEKYETFAVKSDNEIFPTPDESEENLIAMVANIVMNGSIGQYKTPEVTIDFNNKLSKEEKIKIVVRQFKKTFGVLKYADPENVSSLPFEDNKGI
jgi:hypothetical protein